MSCARRQKCRTRPPHSRKLRRMKTVPRENHLALPVCKLNSVHPMVNRPEGQPGICCRGGLLTSRRMGPLTTSMSGRSNPAGLHRWHRGLQPLLRCNRRDGLVWCRKPKHLYWRQAQACSIQPRERCCSNRLHLRRLRRMFQPSLCGHRIERPRECQCCLDGRGTQLKMAAHTISTSGRRSLPGLRL